MIQRVQNVIRVIWYLTNKGIRGAALGGAFAPGPGTVIGAFLGIILNLSSLIRRNKNKSHK